MEFVSIWIVDSVMEASVAVAFVNCDVVFDWSVNFPVLFPERSCLQQRVAQPCKACRYICDGLIMNMHICCLQTSKKSDSCLINLTPSTYVAQDRGCHTYSQSCNICLRSSTFSLHWHHIFTALASWF